MFKLHFFRKYVIKIICTLARNIHTYETLLNEMHIEEMQWLTPFNAFFLQAEQIQGKMRLDPGTGS